MKRDPKPGSIPEGRLGIYTHKGDVVGNVGPKATHATVARFLGHHGAKLGKKDGRPAWIEPVPPPPKPPPKPAAQPTAQPAASPAGGGSHTLEISLKAAKGSVNKSKGKVNEGRQGARQ